MKSKNANSILFVIAITLAAVFYGVLALFKSSPAYDFFYSRGLYQPLSLTAFFFGLALVWNRWIVFRAENADLDIAMPEAIDSREQAVDLASRISKSHGSTILGRRLTDLLRGFARREELGTLEERLKAKDRNDLDQSAGLIGWVRSLPPLIGLLGTLDGLRGGIAEISMISNASDLEALRGRLQSFAQHASTAFDTTLLGIGAAAVLSAAIFVLRKSEDTYLGKVDAIADDIALSFPHQSEFEGQISEAVNGVMAGFTRQFETLMVSSTGPVVREFGRCLNDGMAGAVDEWIVAWREELSRATRQVLDGVDQRNATGTHAAQAALHESVGQLSTTLRALEMAVARPHPVHIRISGEAAVERVANGD